jgi:hypothetical protein
VIVLVHRLLFDILPLLLALNGGRAQISEHDLREAREESAALIKMQTVEKDSVIVKSTAAYKDARRVAVDAAQRLGLPLDLRGLAPHRGSGLTFSREECKGGAFDYPCYVARGRSDDGAYVSVEYSTAYDGFRPGLYIVVIAGDSAGGDLAKRSAQAAKKVFRDAYVRRTGVYLGCIH